METIIEGCKVKDRKSQEQLYKQFYPGLFALCKSLLGEKHDALTALNNGMLKVFTHIHQYDSSKGELFNWAYKIIRNAALTLMRDRNSNFFLEINEDITEQENNNPFKVIDWADIYQYLDKLPRNTRAVCTLFYIEEFSINEITEALGMKDGTVKWHLSESRRLLKDFFLTSLSIVKNAG